jgi:hypothetical protein
LFEDSIRRFSYEGRIAGFDLFVVFGAVYTDESGDDPKHKRIGIATSFTDIGHWTSFDTEWRKVLVSVGRERDFHANRQDNLQQALNIVLATLMKQHRVYSFCTTIDHDEYHAATTALQRGWYGNEYGFARYVSLVLAGHSLNRLNRGDFGYYVDQGGKGVDWIMQTMATIYRIDRLRAQYRMAAFGLVDRRKDLPVHAADLVAHEVITNRDASLPLSILGENVEIDDTTHGQIAGAMTEFTRIQKYMRHLKQKHKNERKAKRKS